MKGGSESRSLPEARRHGPVPLGAREFDRIRHLLEARTGVHLSEGKSAFVVARLARRLRELGLDSYEAYVARLDLSPHVEGAEFVDRLLTNETRLFREAWQFDFIEQTILPQWIERARAGGAGTVRIWSAACSTGEEPASLAAVLAAKLGPEASLRARILATDLSNRALAAARELTFPLTRAEDVPARFSRYFERRDGRLRLAPHAARLIEFARENLLDMRTPPESFDLILCRNVLIYFPRETKRRVLRHLWRSLRPGGYLFVGHAESLVGLIDGQRPVVPAVYRKTSEATE